MSDLLTFSIQKTLFYKKEITFREFVHHLTKLKMLKKKRQGKKTGKKIPFKYRK